MIMHCWRTGIMNYENAIELKNNGLKGNYYYSFSLASIICNTRKRPLLLKLVWIHIMFWLNISVFHISYKNIWKMATVSSFRWWFIILQITCCKYKYMFAYFFLLSTLQKRGSKIFIIWLHTYIKVFPPSKRQFKILVMCHS